MDLSKLSDDELKALLAQAQQERATKAGIKPYSATEGIPWYENFAAGMGKAFMDTGRGVGNIVTDVLPSSEKLGFATRKDTDETKKYDAPLMGTTAGTLGDIAGNVIPALAVPASTIPRALLSGAALAGAQPVGTKDSRTENMLEGGMFAAAVPAAIGAVKTGRAVVEPIVAPRRTAARVLEQFADDPAALRTAAMNAAEIVPNSKPTLAQVAQQPGISSLERGAMNQPGPLQKAMSDRMTEQNAARLAELRDLAGTDGRYDFTKASRSQAAEDLYGRAFGEVPADSSWIKGEVSKLMQRPSFTDALKDAQRLAMDQGIKVSPKNPENTTQLLHFTKMALDDKIEAATRAGSGNQARALIDTRDKLVSLMESKDFSPSYREARDTFKQMSKPLNEMEIAQELFAKANPNGQAVAGGDGQFLRNSFFAEMRRRSGDIDRTFSPESKSRLDAIARDTKRAADAEGLGKPLGSPTAQFLTTQNLMRNVTGPLGLPGSFSDKAASALMSTPYVGGVLQFGAKGAEQRVQQELAQMLMDPATAAQAMEIIKKQPGLMGRTFDKALPYLPAVSASGMFAYSQ